VPSVFLSHSFHDAAEAKKLCDRLSAEGIFVWLAEAQLLPGDSLIPKIQDAIREVDFVAVLLSKASVGSAWVAKEVQVALNEEIAGRRVIVVPIILEPCDVPAFLADKVYADLSDDFELAMARLIERFHPAVPGSRTRKSHAQRLLSLGFDRWITADRPPAHLLRPEDVRDIVRHLEIDRLAPGITDYLVESTISALGAATFDVAPLATRFNAPPRDVLERRFAPLLSHHAANTRIGTARFLGAIAAAGDLLLQRIPKETDPWIRRALLEAYEGSHVLTPAQATAILRTTDRNDWWTVGRALQALPGTLGACIISDGTGFAADLGRLAAAAGCEVALATDFEDWSDVDHRSSPLSGFSLVVLVRGEHYSREESRPLYEALISYVQQGGSLFATSWVAWEAAADLAMRSLLPVIHAGTSFDEDVVRTIVFHAGTTPDPELSLPIHSLSVRGSFERLLMAPDGVAMLRIAEDDSPFLALRHAGQGLVVYLNVCQHYCGNHRSLHMRTPVSTMPSPLTNQPQLSDTIQSVLSWLATASRRTTHPANQS